MGNNLCYGSRNQPETEYEKTVRIHREGKKTFKSSFPNQSQGFEAQEHSIHEKHTDKEFPPSKQSLIDDWENPDPDVQESAEAWKDVKWIRAPDIEELKSRENGKIQVFWGGIEPNDIQQRQLGDCYFLSSLSVIAEQEERIKKMFEKDPDQTIPEGIFALSFTKNGRKVQVVVDDFIPCKDGRIIFSHAHDNELWVMLLEKAWAKIHGSYARIIGGQAHETLRDLTGAPAWEYLTSEEDTWEKIYKADKKKHIMAAGVSAENQEQAAQFEKLGLVNGHAYGLIGCAEVKDISGNLVKIVNVRNPWGQFEWNGNWSDKSPCWTEESKRQVNLVDANDGAFWIDFEEFRQCFSRIQICKYENNAIFSEFNQGLKFQNQNTYHLLKMKINEQGKHTIGVSQKDERCFKRNSGYEYQSCRLILIKLLNGSNLDGGIEFIIGDKGFCQRDTYLEIEMLQKGTYYLIIDADIDANTYVDEPDFNVNSYGPGQTSFTSETQVYQREQVLEAAFRSKFKKNPDICQKHDYSSNGYSKIVKYSCTQPKEGYMFTLIENDESKISYHEQVTYQNQGLDLLPAWDQNEKDVTISQNVYNVESKPGSSKMIILRAQCAGYSMSSKTSLSFH